ncbi:MAG TPA: aminoacetone oxidase family FAD-binding enzyme, partial [Bacilli bacterium]|nr:aminoacetone oxidase family FAD-binding enzyme [Bacilli bacterium]
MYDVVIIGGGAAGLMTAARLIHYKSNLSILILEKNNKLGKKLLLTGNGRCNLGNTNIISDNYLTSNKRILDFIINNENIENLFYDLGILVKEEEGRLYPYSMQSKTVVNAFTKYLLSNNVSIRYNTVVEKIEKKHNIFVIDDEVKARYVVLTTGGASYENTGSSKENYNLVKDFNHNIIPITPALVPLKTSINLKPLDGVRIDAKVSLYNNNVNIYEEYGQIQFTKKYISGICIFNISLFIKEFKNTKIKCDLMNEYGYEEVKEILFNTINKYKEYSLCDVLSNVLNDKVAEFIANKFKNKKVKLLSEQDINNIIKEIKELEFDIIDTTSFDMAQITK